MWLTSSVRSCAAFETLKSCLLAQAGDHPWLAAGYEADGMTPVPTAASDPDAPDAEGTAGGEVAAPAEGAD